jgi:hypothetical protein
MKSPLDVMTANAAAWTWRCIRCANLGLVAAVEARSAKLGLEPAKVLALASSRDIPLDQLFEVLEAPGQLARLQAADGAGAAPPEARATRAQSVARLRELVQQFDAASRSRASAELMPVGVTQLPPHRTSSFDLKKLPVDSVIDAQGTLETNSDPVSNPTFERPADPLFATWIKAYKQLGTRSLTMSEMAGLNYSEVTWSSRAIGLPVRSNFELRLLANEARMEKHELHKYVGGFRGHPGVATDSIAAGRGGESSLFARMTDVYNDHDLPTRWGEESVIRDYWKEHRSPTRSVNEAQPDKWTLDANDLGAASREQVLEKLNRYRGNGYYGDPREQQKLLSSTRALLASEPGSQQRIAAANALTSTLRDRANVPDLTSVSGATAEIQMTETLYRYMNDNRLDFSKPNDQINVVEVYRLYRKLLTAGELTSRATVESWLKEWKVPYVP